jgi:hypothetical protein
MENILRKTASFRPGKLTAFSPPDSPENANPLTLRVPRHNYRLFYNFTDKIFTFESLAVLVSPE